MSNGTSEIVVLFFYYYYYFYFLVGMFQREIYVPFIQTYL